MRAFSTRFGLLSALGILCLSICAGLAAAGPGDVPPEFDYRQLQLWESHKPIIYGVDETDDSTGYDVLHYNVEIQFFPANHSVIGHVDMLLAVTGSSLSYCNLNLRNNMIVDSVKVDGVSAVRSFVGLDGLRITLPTTLYLGDSATVSLWYHGYPLTGSMAALSWGTHLGTYIISSLSEPDGARTWWPCKDVPWDKANGARMVWTVPSNLYATANGLLQSITTAQTGWKSYEWVEDYPITTYLIAVTATNFAHFRNWYVSASGDSLPLDHYVYPEDSLDATLDFADLAEVITYFASVFGEYPFMAEKYGHVEFPWGGGMEHQTLTSLGSSLINGMGTYHWIIVHELSHQWWGDMVTCETWMDIWLNEGTATYCDALWTYFDQGWTAGQNRMASFRSQYFSAEAGWEGRFPIYNPDDMWGATVYQKGAWIEHMLHYIVGEDNFWNFWPEYRMRFAMDNATTAEFQQTWEDVSGMDLDWFFWEWVYMAGYPEYQWGWQTQNLGDSTRVNLSIHQVQDLVNQTPIFNMPIQIKIVRPTGNQIVVVQDSLAEQNFTFMVSGGVTDVLFDPDVWILKTDQEVPFAPPAQTIAFSPVSPPIQIPASGGGFDFNVTVANTATTPATFDAWIMVKMPAGTWYGPALGPITLTLPAGGSLTRLRTQNVPGSAPAGTYYYEGRIGDYPGSITHTSSFSFVKLGAGGWSLGAGEWTNMGEEFGDVGAHGSAPWSGSGATPTIAISPNPFNPMTTLTFTLPEASIVRLEVFDVQGRAVGGGSTPALHRYLAGSHEITFDGSGLPSGVYYYRLTARTDAMSGKMVLMK